MWELQTIDWVMDWFIYWLNDWLIELWNDWLTRVSKSTVQPYWYEIMYITYPYAWTVNFEMRLEGNDSAGNSAGHSIEISIIYRLSKSVPCSLITLIKMLTFWPRNNRSRYWLDSHCWTRTGTGTFQRLSIEFLIFQCTYAISWISVQIWILVSRMINQRDHANSNDYK